MEHGYYLTLRAQSPDVFPREIKLFGPPLIVGRCDVKPDALVRFEECKLVRLFVLSSPRAVSRVHARFYPVVGSDGDQRWFIYNLSVTNGTCVNGEEILLPTEIRADDLINFTSVQGLSKTWICYKVCVGMYGPRRARIRTPAYGGTKTIDRVLDANMMSTVFSFLTLAQVNRCASVSRWSEARVKEFQANVRTFKLNQTFQSSLISRALWSLNGLRTLDLSMRVKVDCSEVLQIANSPVASNLERLYLVNVGMVDRAREDYLGKCITFLMGKCIQLKVLVINGFNTIPLRFPENFSVEELDMSYTWSPDNFETIGNCSRLSKLTLGGRDFMNGDGVLRNLTAKCSTLVKVMIKECLCLTAGVLVSFIKERGGGLNELRLDVGNSIVGGDVMRSIGDNCNQLRTLEIKRPDVDVSHHDLEYMIEKVGAGLVHLSLASSPVPKSTIDSILRTCHSLEGLYLVGSALTESSHLFKLQDDGNCPKIRTLNIRMCRKVNATLFGHLKRGTRVLAGFHLSRIEMSYLETAARKHNIRLN